MFKSSFEVKRLVRKDFRLPTILQEFFIIAEVRESQHSASSHLINSASEILLIVEMNLTKSPSGKFIKEIDDMHRSSGQNSIYNHRDIASVIAVFALAKKWGFGVS